MKLPRLSTGITDESNVFQKTAIIPMSEYINLLELQSVLNKKPTVMLKHWSYYVIVEESEVIKKLIEEKDEVAKRAVFAENELNKFKSKTIFERIFNWR